MSETVLGCGAPPPRELIRAVEQFNGREFFECHETLEALWKQERGPIRGLYQGILQVAVGFHHLERGNYRGTLLSLERGLARLHLYPSDCLGLATGSLASDVKAAHAAVVALGGARLKEFDVHLIPTIRAPIMNVRKPSVAT